MKRLLSLFDYSGQWPLPFQGAGWDVIMMDIQDGRDINEIISAGYCLEEFGSIDGILAAPPCTHFTNSGAQYWKAKDEDGRTQEAIELVYQVQRLANLFTPTDPEYYEEMEDASFFWAVENPVGRMPKLIPGLGEAFYFQPWEYAGHLDLSQEDLQELDRIRAKDGKGVTAEEANFVLECNAYTKKTGLWGDFNRDLEKRPIEPVKVCAQGSPIQRFGGKSDATKSARSNTPQGFAKAFFEANKNHQAEIY